MTINTRRLRASLPAVSGPQRTSQQNSARSYVLWLFIFLPVVAILTIHLVSTLMERGG